MKNIKRFLLSILLASTILLQSCATIFNGTTDTIKINTEPQGAAVEINGISRGKTPVEVSLHRAFRQNPVVIITKPGYKTQTVKIRRDLNLYTLINIINPFGFIVDLLTGSFTKFSPKEYNLVLEKDK